jgi:chemotaxis protein CheX
MPVMPSQASAAQNAKTDFVDHFATSVREVFSTMLATTVTVGTPVRKTDPAPRHDISAVIGFSGNVVGSMVLSFDRSVASTIVQTFTGMPAAVDSQDFADAVGELANMVAGAAKKHFGTLASISLPSVILGAGHAVARLHDIPCIIIPCTTALGRFDIEVSIINVSQPT